MMIDRDNKVFNRDPAGTGAWKVKYFALWQILAPGPLLFAPQCGALLRNHRWQIHFLFEKKRLHKNESHDPKKAFLFKNYFVAIPLPNIC